MKESSQNRPYIIRFHLYGMFRIGKFIETKSSHCLELGRTDRGVIDKWHGASYGSDL